MASLIRLITALYVKTKHVGSDLFWIWDLFGRMLGIVGGFVERYWRIWGEVLD